MSNQKQIRYYTAPNGKSPYAEWISGFKDHTIQSRIERRVKRILLGQYGVYKPVEDGVYELVLNFGPGYRIYFAEEGDIAVLLLCGGDKSTQKKDILNAKRYLAELRGI